MVAMETNDTYVAMYDAHLARLESLVRRLLPLEKLALLDPWALQLELLDYHFELQMAIKAENDAKAVIGARIVGFARSGQGDVNEQSLRSLQGRLDGIKHRIEIHNHVLRLARCIGDAVAWLVLGHNRRYIVLHAENAPHGNVPPRESVVAMVETAKGLSSRYGYPILHDLTNWLRIGDLTFVSTDGQPICYEVKAQQPIDVEGGKLYVMSAEGFSMAPDSSTTTPPEVALDEPFDKQVDQVTEESLLNDVMPRRVRQLRRMHDARVLFDAEPNTTVSVRGQDRMMGAYPRGDGDYHFDVMNQVVNAAMRDNYSSCVVDDALLYFAVRTDKPVWYPWQARQDLPHCDQLVADALVGGLWDPKGHDTLYTHLGGTWEHLGGGLPPHVKPFLLYQYLPLEAKVEILHGRLTVGVWLDLRRVYEALVAIGVDARLPANSDEVNVALIPVSVTTTLPDGRRIIRDLDVVRWLGWELIHHCLSLPAFAREVEQIVEQVAERDSSVFAEVDLPVNPSKPRGVSP